AHFRRLRRLELGGSAPQTLARGRLRRLTPRAPFAVVDRDGVGLATARIRHPHRQRLPRDRELEVRLDETRAQLRLLGAVRALRLLEARLRERELLLRVV